MNPRALVIVANRLPVEPAPSINGAVSWQLAPGGVVSVLTSVFGNEPCTWVGYGQDSAPAQAGAMRLAAVQVDAATYTRYYSGFCNSTLWPLYHDAIRPSRYQQDEFDAFEQVNHAFTDRIANIAPLGTCVWIHDYHLQLVPLLLRQQRPDLRIGFFLHTPFPATEVFSRLPWREQILDGVLGADVIGLQTPGDARSFIDACARITGREIVGSAVRVGEHTAAVGAFPVGVNAAEFAAMAIEPGARTRALRLREEWGSPRTVLLGIDRLDYTKGIPQRLRAFAEALHRGDLDPRATAFIQVAEPTRDTLEAYRAEGEEVASLVDEINHQYPATRVVYYLNRSLNSKELVEFYLAADVLVCTPLRDGMNLVAKEYVASRTDCSGALVLSEFAGAAQQLVGAWQANPFDSDALRCAIAGAVNEPDAQARERMNSLRRCVQVEDARAWADGFLGDLSQAMRPENLSARGRRGGSHARDHSGSQRLCCTSDKDLT